jgi:hypothetical protein
MVMAGQGVVACGLGRGWQRSWPRQAEAQWKLAEGGGGPEPKGVLDLDTMAKREARGRRVTVGAWALAYWGRCNSPSI